jgi:hypothetical protein
MDVREDLLRLQGEFKAWSEQPYRPWVYVSAVPGRRDE